MKKFIKLFTIFAIVLTLGGCKQEKIKSVSIKVDSIVDFAAVSGVNDSNFTELEEMFGKTPCEVVAYFDEKEQKLTKLSVSMKLDMNKLIEKAKQQSLKVLEERGIKKNSKEYKMVVKEMEKEFNTEKMTESFKSSLGSSADIKDLGKGKLLVKQSIEKSEIKKITDKNIKKALEEKDGAKKYVEEINKKIKDEKLTDKVKVETKNY